jgi:hypothetical protein
LQERKKGLILQPQLRGTIEGDGTFGDKKRLKFFEKLEANKKPGKERQHNLFNS